MIRFSSYMNEWLYGEGGYYQDAMIGKAGDFYTAVSVSKFFGGSIANYLLNLLENGVLTLPLKIIEVGTHKGYLLNDVAQFLQTLSEGVVQNCEFISIEPLPLMARFQKEYFIKHSNLELKIYQTFDELETDSNDCVFCFSNELFDAFACELIDDNKMAYIKNHQIIWGDVLPEVDFFRKKYEIFQGEIPILIEDFISCLIQKLNHFKDWIFLTFDYGDWESRNDINLRVYKNHQVKNFLDIKEYLRDYYQKSDITYDVNFSFLTKCFESFGAKKVLYGNQGKVLIELGLMDLLEKFSQNTSYEGYLREISKIKPLISPGGFGERFQGIVFKK
ncbi:SAM-dependent methyltransferase [Helicobacter sp. 13S00477-4]|uniref:SAM-dependent methyltransferase n=1 Tax=Helicobacter sp. 13S00477-4 TaxID=1905759 RepID=UPI000BA640FC|nr:SAM-dependent methyltransferase [Helicobacter sp. 13S00477-4]PAF52747.1 hypothetical protein BKH44_00755 [Helicobacter sp. 13S00477-4]